MDEDLIAELRQLLEELVVADLKELSAKFTAVLAQFEAYDRAVNAKMDAILAELVSMRTELHSMRAESRARADGELDEEHRTPAKPPSKAIIQ